MHKVIVKHECDGHVQSHSAQTWDCSFVESEKKVFHHSQITYTFSFLNKKTIDYLILAKDTGLNFFL